MVRAKPRASRPGIGLVREGALEIRVGAPPVEGAANTALIHVIAEALGVVRRAVTLVQGERGRTKRFRVEGISLDEARARLGRVAPP